MRVSLAHLLFLVVLADQLVLAYCEVTADAAFGVHILDGPLVPQMILPLLVTRKTATRLLGRGRQALTLLDLLALLAVDSSSFGSHVLL